MVLSLKTWKSRSLPGLPRTVFLFTICKLKAWCESQFSIRNACSHLDFKGRQVNLAVFSVFEPARAGYPPSHLLFTSVHGERIKPKRKPRSDSHRINGCAVRYFSSESIGQKSRGAKWARFDRWWQPDAPPALPRRRDGIAPGQRSP